MCFSAGASFGAAAILGGVGVISLKETIDRKQVMFAAIPVLFGVQQACEGVLWLLLSRGTHSSLETTMTYIFLFFAQILWSSWIPVSVLLMETDKRRGRLLQFLSVMGISCSLLLAYRLVFYGVSAEIKEHHIHYDIQSPQVIITVSSVLYFIATLFPFFISGVKGTKLLGILLAASLLISRIFYDGYFISVWCFFAALLSIVIVFILKGMAKEIPRPAI